MKLKHVKTSTEGNDMQDQKSEYRKIPASLKKNGEKDEKEVPFMTTSLKADKTVKMGIITDIKQELRQVNALKLSYTASKEVKD